MQKLWNTVVFLLLATSFIVIAECKIRFDGYKVFRVKPHTKSQLELIHKLHSLGASFWDDGPPSKIGKSTDIMIPPHLQGDLLQALRNSTAETNEFVPDVQKLIDAETVNNKRGAKMSWTEYQRLDTIYEYLEDQAANHPDIAEVITIGKSYENRDIKLMKIAKSKVPKESIWIDSNIHAREWISGAVTTFLIDQLLNGGNAELNLWLDNFDFYILPIANPDGFEYTHDYNRMWRKTRSQGPIAGCYGADPNRNFAYKWMTGGSSNYPCDDTYGGSSAASESEVRAITDFFDSIANTSVCFISIHSYSQYILLPYGLADQELEPEEYANFMRIANKAAVAISGRYGTQFTSGSITDLLYPASGSSMDYVKGVHNTNLTLSFELRDTGRYGFILPPSQIIPSAMEFIDGLQVFIDELRLGVIPPTKKSSETNKHNKRHHLKSSPPGSPILYDTQTFGVVPNVKGNAPIIPGFRNAYN